MFFFLLCNYVPFCIAIEDDYTGPALEDGKVTLNFMKDLMEYYKQEKRLHKKYAYKVSCFIPMVLNLFSLVYLFDSTHTKTIKCLNFTEQDLCT